VTEEWFQELGPKWEKTSARQSLVETIDIHSHVEVPRAAEIAAPFFRPEFDPRVLYQSEESSRYNRELRATQVAKFVDPEARIADMDLQGVDRQVLAIAPPQYFYYLDEPTGARVTAIQNDRIAEMVASHPSRFVGVANLPLDHPRAAIAEMVRAHRDLGFNGFEINADVNGGELDDRRFDPLWEKATELNLLVILHPHGFTDAKRMGDYYLANVICMPLASTLAVSRMILGGVWERFPDLRMLVVHGGGYLPFYFARTDHAFRVRPELRHHISRPPSEYLHMLHFDTTVFDPKAVEYLVAEFGADRVLMGSDYPFDMGPTDPLGFVAEAKLSAADRDLVVGGNAARLLGIGRSIKSASAD
jgi:aminocarboxymuconate-semialdehyde decarboxylase